jgi:hypothetical protein
MKKWVKTYLDDSEEDENRWATNTTDNELEELVKDLKAQDDCPLASKGRSYLNVRAAVREMQGERERSRSRTVRRSRSHSKCVARSTR